MLKPQIPVAKEGIPFIGISAFITLIFAIMSYSWLMWPSLLLTIFVVSFFRDPERFVPEDQSTLVSPADGKIIVIETVTDDDFTKGQAYKVSIFMNVFNVHVNRIPFSGTVKQIMYKPGKFYAADSRRGALHNEHCATILKTDTNHTIAFVQMAGLIARRIVCWLETGDKVKKGRRFGLIRFGSRVDLYLPLDAQILVHKDQKVKAGETPICKLQ